MACTKKSDTTDTEAGDRGTSPGEGRARARRLTPILPAVEGRRRAGRKTDFGLGDVSFNETAEWDQAKQNEVLNSLAAQGYNAFGIFGVSPDRHQLDLRFLEEAGFRRRLAGSCPAGDVNEADFCLSTDTEVAAYKAALAAIDAMGGSGTLVHLTGNNVDANTQRRITGVEKAVAETGKVPSPCSLPSPTSTRTSRPRRRRSPTSSPPRAARSTASSSTAYNPAVASASLRQGIGPADQGRRDR